LPSSVCAAIWNEVVCGILGKATRKADDVGTQASFECVRI